MNLRLLGIATLIAATTVLQAEISLTILQQEKKLGSAVMDQKILPDGSKQVVITMAIDLPSNPGAIRVRSESIYSKEGLPIRMIRETTQKNMARESVIATFDAEGANVIFTRGSEAKTSVVPYPKEVPLKNVSEFWFISTKPATGTSCTAYVFNTTDLTFHLTKTEFFGRKKAKMQGKEVEGNLLITNAQGKATAILVDDKGLPIYIDGPVRMERDLEKK